MGMQQYTPNLRLPTQSPMRTLLGAGTIRYGPLGMTATTNVVVTAGRLIVFPAIIMPATMTAVSIRTSAGAAGNCRIGIWNDNDGAPGTLILDCGEFSTAATGLIETAISQRLAGGRYWIGSIFSAAPTCNCVSTASGLMGYGSTSSTSAPVLGYTRTVAYGPLGNETGNTFSAIVTSATGAPVVLIG